MTDFEAKVLADLSVLKSHMEQIIGGVQPGRLVQLESRIQEHEKTMQRWKGMAGAFGAVLTFAHLAIDLVIGRR